MRCPGAVRCGLLLVAALLMVLPASAEAQSWRDLTLSRVRSAERVMDVRVRYGAGELDLMAAEDADLLYRAELRYDEDRFEPVAEYQDGVLEVGVTSIGRNIKVGRQSQAHLDLTLSRSVPLRLDVEVGAADVEMDLGGLQLASLELQTGASRSLLNMTEANPIRMEFADISAGAAEFTARGLGNFNADRISVDAGVGDVHLDFTGAWERDAQVEIDMGLGALHLTFPEGLGVMIRKDSFLTSFDASGLRKRGDAFYSENWDDAGRRITIDLDAAFGSVDIDWSR